MSNRTPKPRIILDCDPGLDDAVAIALAVRHADVVGITTVGGNVGLEHTTANTLALCDILAVPELEVHAGHDLPLSGSLDHRATEYHGPFGTGSVRLAEPSRPATSDDAVDWIIGTVRAEEGIALVATGPLTNIALAFQKAPDIVDKISEISWMGGSSNGGNTTPGAEFNSWVDPEAAAIVFAAGHPNLVMVGLNVTHTVLLDRPWIEQLRQQTQGTKMEVFADLLDYYEVRQREMTMLAGAAVHDALAVLHVTHPELLAGVRRPVEIVLSEGPARGMTLVDLRPMRSTSPAITGPENAKVVEWANVLAIQELIGQALSA